MLAETLASMMLCYSALLSMACSGHAHAVESPCAGSLGVADLMAEDISSHEELHALQREDLTAIGRLLLMLACSSMAPSLDTVAATYSQGFVRALSALLASAQGTSFSSWQQVCSAYCVIKHSPVPNFE